VSDGLFSRYVVGWMVAPKESAALARRLISETLTRQGIAAQQLTIHADRGTSMRSKAVAQLLADLGVTKTHSRPHVSNDNPYSEAGFKTLKYRPDYPGRFGSQEHARAFNRDFFDWYNDEHHHSGLALMTPHDVHYGLAESRRVVRRRGFPGPPRALHARPADAARVAHGGVDQSTAAGESRRRRREPSTGGSVRNKACTLN